MIVLSTAGDAARYLLAFFLLVTGLTLGWALLRLAAVFDRLASLLRGAEKEILPVIGKVGGSVDRVNAQLDKLDTATDSAVDAVQAVDHAVRAVGHSVSGPARKLGDLAGVVARAAARRRGAGGRPGV